MMAVSMMVGAAGAGVSAFGTTQTAEAQAQMAQYQAQVARNNAIIQERNAEWAVEAGLVKESAHGMKTRANLGEIRTAQAASGVDVRSGSFADVSDSARALGVLDALTIRSNAAREAYGYKVAATEARAKAQMHELEAHQAKKAGEIGFWSSLLGGAASLTGKYAQFAK